MSQKHQISNFSHKLENFQLMSSTEKEKKIGRSHSHTQQKKIKVKSFRHTKGMSDTNNSTHSEFPKGFDALPRPFVVVIGNQKYHSMVVRRGSFFSPASDDASDIFSYTGTNSDRLSNGGYEFEQP